MLSDAVSGKEPKPVCTGSNIGEEMPSATLPDQRALARKFAGALAIK